MPNSMACSLCEVLLDWFHQHGRDLPWRHTRDPYAIWLSEIILQQTRIEQGTSYWLRMMQRFPRVELLAAATEDEVLRLWQGLGYYSRARNLHAAAKQIVDRGSFPNTYEEIKQLKGVGDYTAAAIGSFAFALPVAVVDGNVYRVLARYFGIDTPIVHTRRTTLHGMPADGKLHRLPNEQGGGAAREIENGESENPAHDLRISALRRRNCPAPPACRRHLARTMGTVSHRGCGGA